MLDKKEMTALVPSVGADERQPSQKVCKNSIPASDKEINENVRVASNPLHLHTVSMTELYQTTYASRPPIIDGLLYAGAYILAGAPKIGKSFLVAQLAYHVSAGSRLWNYKVHQGAVLYLALEDDFQRIQSRMFMMYGVEDSEKLYFATAANKVGQGLNDQLENFIKEHADTKLIIIDTMQKIREFSGEAYSYASDYAIIGQLKQFADKHGICLLIVHHTRKMESEDSFDMISGTNGLLGAADGAFILQKKKRTDTNAVLSVVGRDQQDQELLLQFDHEKCVWKLIKAETEVWRTPPDPVLLSVSKLVTPLSPEWRGTPSELHAQLADVPLLTHVLTRHLNANADLLYNDYGILYKTKRSHANRIIILTLEKAKA